MADVPGCDLTALVDAIKAALVAQFPSVTVEDHFRTDAAEIKAPAILFEISQVEPTDGDGNTGTEQFSGLLKFEARCLVRFKTARAELECRKFALNVAAFVFQKRWGSAPYSVSPARITGVFPDNFDPNLDERYSVQRVDWEQSALFGTSIWAPRDDDPPTPEQVFAGITPKIGPPHVDDYLELTEGRVPDVG